MPLPNDSLILPGPITVNTVFTNQPLVLTYVPVTGTSTIRITSISSSANLPYITYSSLSGSFAASASMTIGGKYSLALFTLNEISCIPRGGTNLDIPSTVSLENSFDNISSIGLNARQVFKLVPDVRIIPVTYTIVYDIRTTTLANAISGLGGGTVDTLGLITTVIQTVSNDYASLSTALLLVID